MNSFNRKSKHRRKSIVRVALIRGIVLGAVFHSCNWISLCQAGDKSNSSTKRPSSAATEHEKASSRPATVTATYEKGRSRFVHAYKSIVRCGPGESYYATKTLMRGAAVDVYLETSDGWSGIRPPEDSHNWIPAETVYLLPGGKTAEVSVDKAPAWVGAENPEEPELLWQSEFVKTQTVMILGEAYQGEEPKRKLWFKIAPPQGEFRWVRTSQLDDNPIELIPDSSQLAGKKNESAQESLEKPSAVELASHQVPVSPRKPGASSANSVSAQEGELVWSDEADQLAKVDREIQAEQDRIEREMAAQGVKASTKKSSPTKSLVVPNHGGTYSESPSAAPSSSSTASRTSRTTKGMMKQLPPNPITQGDAKHWEAIQSKKGTSPSPTSQRVAPINNVLGLFGMSVIEADRNADVPGSGSIKPIPAGTPVGSGTMGSDVARVAAGGSSRLQNLPRPGRRSNSDYRSDYRGDGRMASTTTGSGVNGRGGILSDLINSNQPLFGGRDGLSDGSLADHRSGTAGHSPSRTSFDSNTNFLGMSDYSSSVDTYSDEKEPEEFQTSEIQDALVRLSRTVAKPTEQWDFTMMRDQATRWVEAGPTPLVRGEARLLLDRINRFESIRQRTLAMASSNLQFNALASSNSAPMGQGAGPSSQVTPASYTSAVPPSLAEPGGEASGWLVQVHTSVPGQPEFALTDDAGSVVAYLQPMAGLNLRRYLQQPVTVYGTRGYIPNLAAKQVLVERVVRLKPNAP